jgi:hypothetical protein
MKKFLNFAILVIIIGTYSSCTSYKTMTAVPKKYVLEPEWNNTESEINFSATQSMTPFRDELKKLENERFDNQVDEHHEEFPIVVKTKNPLYHPNQWIKTKDPLYHPNKWIKVCAWGACIKTKDPLYHPNKWIKTKDPAYSPNRYTTIVTSLSTVNGYKISAWIDGKIKLTPFDGNKFNIKVPIKTNGWITLITPYTPPFIREQFEGKMMLDLDIEIDIDSKWCVKLKPNASFSWIDRLKLDLTYGLKILQVDITKLANPEIEKLISKIEEDISKSFDCENFRKQAEKEWVTRKFQIDEQFWAIAKPTQISLSQINADKDNIKIYGGIKSDIKITTDLSDIPNAGNLPDLNIISPTKPSINLSLPIEVPFKYLDSELSNSFNDITIGDDNSEIKGKLLVKKIETFPSGNNIGLKVQFETDMSSNLLDIKATAYFTGKLNHKTVDLGTVSTQVLQTSKHYISYTLDTLAFNDFGNGKDKLILSLAYKTIKKEIENIEDVDISKEVENVEVLLLKAIDELVINLPKEVKEKYKNVEVEKPIVKINEWAYSEKDLILLLNAKVNIK